MDKHERVARELWHSCALPETAWIETASETLRENYPDERKGRCGECVAGQAGHEIAVENVWPNLPSSMSAVLCKVHASRFPVDASCPRWGPREDKADRLAREFWHGYWNSGERVSETDHIDKLADFLRRHGVGGE